MKKKVYDDDGPLKKECNEKNAMHSVLSVGCRCEWRAFSLAYDDIQAEMRMSIRFEASKHFCQINANKHILFGLWRLSCRWFSVSRCRADRKIAHTHTANHTLQLHFWPNSEKVKLIGLRVGSFFLRTISRYPSHREGGCRDVGGPRRYYTHFAHKSQERIFFCAVGSLSFH